MREYYYNARVFAGEEFHMIENCTIVVEDAKIVALTTEAPACGIDLGGAYVIPALINGHCHLGDTGAKELGMGLPVHEAVAPPDGLKHRYLRTLSHEQLTQTIRDGLLEMLRYGICVCADYREGGVDGVDALKEAAAGLPIEVLALGRPLATGRPDDPLTEREVTELLEHGDGLGISSIKAFAMPVMLTLRSMTAERGKLMSIHIAESPSSNRKSLEQFGMSEVERALMTQSDFLVHLTQASEQDIRLLQEADQPIVCCPRTNMVLGDGIPPVDAFFEAGLTAGLGSDNMMFSSPDLFREMDMMYRAICGLRQRPDCVSSMDFLAAATWQGAKALHLQERYGTIEVGKSASFLVLRPDSQAFLHTHDALSSIVHRVGPSDILHFICNGVNVILNGKFLLA